MAKAKLVRRSQKLNFMDVGDDTTSNFQRMTGFTSLPTNKEAKEYSRQYVDEDFERSDVVGVTTSKDFTFDQYADDLVHAKIVDIIDNDRIGDDAYVDILELDLSGGESPYPARKRTFAVMAGTEGDSTDAYTYSGTFKAVGDAVKGTATLDEAKQIAVFTADQTPAG